MSKIGTEAVTKAKRPLTLISSYTRVYRTSTQRLSKQGNRSCQCSKNVPRDTVSMVLFVWTNGQPVQPLNRH